MLDAVVEGLRLLLEPETFALMLLGVAIGFVVGVLPGLGGAVTLALMIPFTFSMEPAQVFAFLLGMWVVTSTTGDITSVLFGIPGESTSAAAMLDGYPMTRRGEAGRALGAVLMAPLLGAVFGAVVLAASVPIIRPLILALGPPAFFALTLVGLTFIIALSGKNVIRGFLMAGLGFVIGMIGLDSSSGIPRYTFGQLQLWDGIDLVPLVVGLFGGAEVLQLMLSRKSIAQRPETGTMQVSGVGRGIRDAFEHWWLVIRSSAIGVGLGVIPGIGGSVSQFIAYGHAQATSKSPETFGKGNIEGVLAAGANNNAKDSGSLIPTIAFGIPGSVGTAVLLGAFLIAGLTPGKEMLTTQLPVTMSMVWVMVIANAIAVAVAFVVLRPLAKLTYIRGTLLVPFLLVLVGIGAYSASNSFIDIFVMLGAAAVGVLAIRFDWPRVPFLLAAILGSIAERYLFLSYSLAGWSWLNDPVVVVLFLVCVAAIARPVVAGARASAAARRAGGDGPDQESAQDPASTLGERQ